MHDKLKKWSSSWWIETHAAHTPGRIASDWFSVSVFDVGCDPLEETGDMLREAILSGLWNVILRLWAAAAAAAAPDIQCGAGGIM